MVNYEKLNPSNGSTFLLWCARFCYEVNCTLCQEPIINKLAKDGGIALTKEDFENWYRLEEGEDITEEKELFSQIK